MPEDEARCRAGFLMGGSASRLTQISDAVGYFLGRRVNWDALVTLICVLAL